MEGDAISISIPVAFAREEESQSPAAWDQSMSPRQSTPRRRRAFTFAGLSSMPTVLHSSSVKGSADDTGCYKFESYKSFLTSSYKTPMAILTWLASMRDDEMTVIQCLSELSSGHAAPNRSHTSFILSEDAASSAEDDCGGLMKSPFKQQLFSSLTMVFSLNLFRSILIPHT
jgi:hypothetical protein